MPAVPAAARALTKTELIHGRLRQGILTLRYRPGDYLNLDALARQHRLSPIPVREAVARLMAERLVVMRPHIGAEVAPLDATSVREVFALLTGLETAAAGDIVGAVTAADVAELKALCGKIDALHLPGQLAAWDQANAAFHLRLAAIARLPTILDQLRVVFEHWDRIRRYFFEIAPGRDASSAQREHRAMIRALAKRDGDRLRDLLHRHNDRARQSYLQLLQTAGGTRSAAPGGKPAGDVRG